MTHVKMPNIESKYPEETSEKTNNVLVEVSPNAQAEEIVDITVQFTSAGVIPKILKPSVHELDEVCFKFDIVFSFVVAILLVYFP